MFKKPFLLYPVILVLGLFVFEKIFSLPAITNYTVSWKKVERSFYYAKEDLYLILKTEKEKPENQNKRFGIVLGSSRSGDFDKDQAIKSQNDVLLFNFSAPFGCPSYHNYWLTRFERDGFKPSFVLIETDPLLFSGSAIRYSLSASYDFNFIINQIDWGRKKNNKNPWAVDGNGFSVGESETWIAKTFFSSYKYPFDYRAIKDNSKKVFFKFGGIGGLEVTGIEYKKKYIENIELANRVKYGGSPNEILYASPDVFLEADAKKVLATHFGPFDPQATQVQFFRKTVRKLAKEKIPTVIYLPMTSIPFRDLVEKKGIWQAFMTGMEDIKQIIDKEFPGHLVTFVEMQKEKSIDCRAFVDSVHLSGACFPQVTDVILKKIPK